MENNPNFDKDLLENYFQFKEEKLKGRYVTHNHIQPLLEKHSKNFETEEIGKSVNEKPIHKIILGTGKIKILAWSQMHGNESTTTKAVFDVLNYFGNIKNEIVSSILENCEIHIIPMLNPDGAFSYTRVNANFVDLNRDAQELTQPESKILRNQFEKLQPDFCFNLHDQRSIFSAGNNEYAATLSFLTPSSDAERSITASRKESMQVIASINNVLQEKVPNQVGRYDDDFNLNCTGDTFQNMNVPTILFEAGQFKDDYNREETRKYVFLALLKGFHSVATEDYKEISFLEYSKIPENEKRFLDVILRNAKVDGTVVDVGIQFKEYLEDEQILFQQVIEKIQENLELFGHKEIDCNYKILKINGKPGFGENVVVNNLLLNNEVLLIK